MKSVRFLVLVPAAVAAAFLVAGCGSAAQPAWKFPVNAPVAAVPVAPLAAVHGAAAQNAPAPVAPAAPAALTNAATAAGAGYAAASIVRESLTIVTGDMIGKTEYPAYVPSNFVLPAHSLVELTITNFDDATALPKGSEQFAKASGIVGSIVVQPIDLTNPNGSKGKASEVTSLNPNDVSHTFTVPSLGINVPIAAHARVTFMFRTGDAGTYAFRCMDPCGAGPSGWGTAMAAKNYMEGSITVE